MKRLLESEMDLIGLVQTGSRNC